MTDRESTEALFSGLMGGEGIGTVKPLSSAPRLVDQWTEEDRQRMARMQQDFDEWEQRQAEDRYDIALGDALPNEANGTYAEIDIGDPASVWWAIAALGAVAAVLLAATVWIMGRL